MSKMKYFHILVSFLDAALCYAGAIVLMILIFNPFALLGMIFKQLYVFRLILVFLQIKIWLLFPTYISSYLSCQLVT